MGNRGDLHAHDGSVSQRRWRVKRWITCTLDPGDGPGVSFDVPGRYYPLFFLDEAVALAAGHRPCAACCRSAFNDFAAAFAVAHGSVPVTQLDRMLHVDRLEHGNQREHQAALGTLPEGAYLTLSASPHIPMIWWGGWLYPWTHAGYGRAILAPPLSLVRVLTPALTIATMKAGYKPRLGKALEEVLIPTS